jgi:hypothetical protein
MAFSDLFKMAPLSEFSQAADALTRNEIMTSNEIRALIGLKPAEDEDADKLRNKNLNKPPEQGPPQEGMQPPMEDPLDQAETYEEFKELV